MSTPELARPDLGSRARRIGARTAVIVAVAVGGVLAFAARTNLGLAVSVIADTLGVAAFAFAIGPIAGAQISHRGWLGALGLGALYGFASVVVAAVLAAGIGLLWGLRDVHDPGFVWDYLGKPFFVVLSYGSVVAVGLGGVAGLLIRGLVGHARPAVEK